ncbi:hypothetical protein OXX80_014055, partial [Metschnikowia pulcherrima]
MASNGRNFASGDEPFSSALPGNVDVPDDKMIDDIFAERTTKHADDAVDYEDIDELADDDEDLPEEEFTHAGEGMGGAVGSLSAFDE